MNHLSISFAITIMTACGYVQAAAPQKVVDSGAHVPMRTDMQSRVRMLSFRPRRGKLRLYPESLH